MSATVTGDAPKRRRVNVSVERDIGRIDATLVSHEKRMNQMDSVHAEQMRDINVRLDSQDGKLDTLILRTAKEDGADESKKFRFENNVNFWLMAASIFGVASVVGGAVGSAFPTFIHHFFH